MISDSHGKVYSHNIYSSEILHLLEIVSVVSINVFFLLYTK